MRCLACNKRLTDYESTIKDSEGRYLDFCKKCFSYVKDDVPAFGNLALLHDDEEELDNEDEGWYNNSIENEDS